MFQYIFLLFVLVQIVLSDDIYIYGPPQNGIYHPKDVMDIRYAVHSMGMTRIWSASAKLTNVETNTTIEGFPLTNWTASNNTQNFSHDIWTIPVDMPNGNYSMCVSGK
ncbi:hypothetical protein INT47_006186 [Mucor saturninus]|uniref:Uncharacterized protein n=1 Tax=Mucor saturninus TaxID=64648 RepID=A0A8H7RD74_9FUNG|nr:hypothetical protein INT47_006186 [Mucor saturninus]